MSGGFTTQGIQIHAWTPRFDTGFFRYEPRGSYWGTIEKFSAYAHKIEAFGGFASASFSFAASQDMAEDWLMNGLPRHIEVTNEGGIIVWEGFVDTVKVNLGALSITRGPVSEVVNYPVIEYTLLDTSTTPPTAGEKVRLLYPVLSGTEYQYGRYERAFSVGAAPTTLALQIAGKISAEYAHPPLTQQWSNEGGELSVSLECLGYRYRLDYPFNNEWAGGTQTVFYKMALCLDYDQNLLFSSGNASLAGNTLAVPANEDGSNRAIDIIKGLVALGDSSYNRYTFGIYEGRKAYYEQDTQRVAYEQRLSEPRQAITTPTGLEVRPWDVRPGKWIRFTDFLTGLPATATLREDPRCMFIESVSFDAAWGLQLQGGKADETSKRMAEQLGLAGISA